MGNGMTVGCQVHGFRPVFRTREVTSDIDPDQLAPRQEIAFGTGDNLRMVITGDVGPMGISLEAADLVDFAAAVFQIEKQLRGRQRTNPPSRFDLIMQLRKPEAWTPRAIELAQDVLLLMGNAEWSLTFTEGLTAPVPEHQCEESSINQVALFSGGMDSTCGLASIYADRHSTRLVSFYTRQKTLQKTLAENLGFRAPVQWGKRWVSELGPGRGRTFYYRSFLFLCLAAAVAESWETRHILQFENGILATAIPPSPAWMMTKHAHPLLHQLVSQLFSEIFGDEWTVENPFALFTKRECFEQAKDGLGEAKAVEAVMASETCWFHASNRLVKPASKELQERKSDGRESWQKRPGTPCGICIPCIIRRTAFEHDADLYRWDLREDIVKNDVTLGAAFRSYFLFLDQIGETKGAAARFYRLLPASGRDLVDQDPFTLEKIHRLFLSFSNEFMEAYDLKGYRR